MLELMLLTLLNRMASWGRTPAIASRAIAADAPTLLALVSDPASQWRLIDGVSARLHPRAHVERVRSSGLVSVRLTIGRRDALWITWLLTPSPGTTEVDLAAHLDSDAVLLRLAMMLGGRRWLRHRLERTLGTVSVLAHRAAEDLDDVEREADRAAAAVRSTVQSVPPAHQRA